MAWRGVSWVDNREQFLSYCAEQYQNGECDLCAYDVGLLLSIIFELETGIKKGDLVELAIDKYATKEEE